MNERPDTEQIKTQLAREIVRLIGEHKLTDAAASRQFGIAEADLSRIRKAEFAELSVDRLIDVLNSLNHRVEVKVSPAAARNPILRIIQRMEEFDAKFPPEESEKVPTDLAQNLDHYLYGAKKTD